MIALRSLARPVIRLIQNLYGLPGFRRLATEAIEEFDPSVLVDEASPTIRLRVTSRMENQRANGFFNKEPDTIRWLDQLRPGDLLLDVGANIGVYSLYAASRCGAQVIAFEPESQNFAALNYNIHRNGLGDKVVAFPLAASDETGPTRLHMSQFATGQSHHSAHAPIGEGGVAFRAAFVQGAIAQTADDAVAAIAVGAVPRFVKIDVDGNELRVLRGMSRLLGDPRLEQVLVELSEGDAEVFAVLHAAGFSADRPESSYRQRGNHIFVRTQVEKAS